jgi:hypothetical protein
MRIRIIPRTDVELSDEQLQRNDTIDNSVFDCLETLAETDLEWDMRMIAEATTGLKSVLNDYDIKVRHPGITTLPGNIQYIDD